MSGRCISIHADLYARLQERCAKDGVSVASRISSLLSDITGQEPVLRAPPRSAHPVAQRWKDADWSPRVVVSGRTLDKLKREAERRTRRGQRLSNGRRVSSSAVLDDVINKVLDTLEGK